MLKHGFATKQHNIKSVISLKQVFEYARNQNKVKPVTVSDIWQNRAISQTHNYEHKTMEYALITT